MKVLGIKFLYLICLVLIASQKYTFFSKVVFLKDYISLIKISPKYMIGYVDRIDTKI